MALAVLVGACGDPLSLAPATFQNRVDTVTVFAVTGTPIHAPSAYLVSLRSAVRIDFFPTFDFAYHIDESGKRSFLPFDLVTNNTRSFGNPGLQPTSTPFGEIEVAEQIGYVTKDTVEARLGQVYYVRSEIPGSCGLGLPFYGKLEVLSFDSAQRSVTFQILTNINCGYRGLEPGIPER
ncbi:MAG: hypothetical protein ACRENB_08950 [Gemmatimonadales bacterium]